MVCRVVDPVVGRVVGRGLNEKLIEEGDVFWWISRVWRVSRAERIF